jgi:hypothetical protein
MKVNTSEFSIQHHQIGAQKDSYYVLKGEHEFLDADDNPRSSKLQEACAKLVFGKKSKHITDRKAYHSYYIKCNPNKEAYNPIQLHSTIKDKKTNAFIDNVCKSEWSFLEVDQSIFNQYLEFLKSHNTRILKDINRSLK